MKKDQLAFLLGGLAFGMLVGYGLFHALANVPASAPPQAEASIDGPQGPAAATQVPMAGGAGSAEATQGGAPMIAEINALKRALQEDPKNLAALARLGNLYQDGGMFEQAIEYYARALAVSPNDPNILTDKGICHEQMKQFDEAIVLFRSAQAADPNHWQSLYNIVVVAGFQLKRQDEAEKALARLEQVNPGAPNLAALKEHFAKVKAGGTL